MFGLFKKKSSSYSLDTLASEVIAMSQKHYPEDQFKYNKKMNVVSSVSGDSPKTFLGNIFNNIKDMPAEDRNAYLEDFFETVKLTSSDLTLETLKSFLLMRVRTASELGLRDLVLSPEIKDKGFFTVTVGELFFDLTVDYGSSLSTPPKSDLVNAGGGNEAVLDIALQNLKTISNGKHWEEVCPHIWHSTYEDDYDAARLVCLYPEYDLPDGVKNPIAYMPSHSDCLITDKDDPETLALMVQKGDEWAVNSRKLSKALWHNKKSGWEPVKLNKSHPSYAFVQHQKRIEDTSFYNEQKELLENKFSTENQDIFVASVLLYEDKDEGSTFSCSVLSFGVETLLPRTERVAFVDPDRPEKDQFLGMLRWDEFVDLIGQDKLTPYKSLNPVRYDFRTNLDDADFKKISQRMN